MHSRPSALSGPMSNATNESL
ncbi:unnamed protein product, partial [Didymodactylos carnosus]